MVAHAMAEDRCLCARDSPERVANDRSVQEKLGVAFRRYVILGACNPPLSHRVLQADLDIGLLLPCNVVLYDDDEGTRVMVMDPQAALGLVNNPAIAGLAVEARTRLAAALEALPHTQPAV